MYLHWLGYAEFSAHVHFFHFRLELPFLHKFGPKNQKCLLKVKFDSYTNSNMQNSVVVFTFSALDLKYLFCTNVVQKIKIVNLSWKMVLRLIRIWRIQWWCSFFLFSTESILFLENFQKNKIFCRSWKLEPRRIRICGVRWWFLFFIFYIGNIFLV